MEFRVYFLVSMVKFSLLLIAVAVKLETICTFRYEILSNTTPSLKATIGFKKLIPLKSAKVATHYSSTTLPSSFSF